VRKQPAVLRDGRVDRSRSSWLQRLSGAGHNDACNNVTTVVSALLRASKRPLPRIVKASAPHSSNTCALRDCWRLPLRHRASLCVLHCGVVCI